MQLKALGGSQRHKGSPTLPCPLKLNYHLCILKKPGEGGLKLWRGKVGRGWGGLAKPPRERGCQPESHVDWGLATTGQVSESSEPLLRGASETEPQPLLAQGGPVVASVTNPFLRGNGDVRRRVL